MQGFLDAWSLYEWIWRLLFIELGVLAGILIKDKFELPRVVTVNGNNPYKKKYIHFGSIAQFVVGFASSFLFQIAGVSLMYCWIYATSLGTVVNVGQRVLARRIKIGEMEVAMKKILIEMAEMKAKNMELESSADVTIVEALEALKEERIAREEDAETYEERIVQHEEEIKDLKDENLIWELKTGSLEQTIDEQQDKDIERAKEIIRRSRSRLPTPSQ